MQVTKQFVPITITLEYKEELDFFRKVLSMAREMHNQRRGWLGSKVDDSFSEKCYYVEKQLS